MQGYGNSCLSLELFSRYRPYSNKFFFKEKYLMAKSASKRQLQVAEMVRRNLSMVFQQEGQYIYGQAMVTITNVMISPDLSLAKVYLSVYNTENKQEPILEIEANTKRLQQALTHRVGKQLRKVPILSFYMDDTLDEMYRLRELFDKLEADNQMGRDREEGEFDDDYIK